MLNKSRKKTKILCVCEQFLKSKAISKNYYKVRHSREITKVRKKPWRIDKIRNPHDTISKDCKPACPKTSTSGGVIDSTTNKQTVSGQL